MPTNDSQVLRMLVCAMLLTAMIHAIGCGGGAADTVGPGDGTDTTNDNGGSATDGNVSDPSIALSLDAVTLSGIEGLGGTLIQRIDLSNGGSGQLNWNASSDASWLTIDPVGGSVADDSAMLTLSADPRGLSAAGSPYRAEVTIASPDTKDGSQTLAVALIVGPADCEPMSLNIRGDRTLSAGCYEASGEVNIFEDATLTLEPGVFLVFGPDSGLTVSGTGRLSAVGTAAEPIVFTAPNNDRGLWNGVRFLSSDSTENRLEYVTIEFAGASGAAALEVDGTNRNPARLTMRNCILRGSASYGLYLGDDITLEAFSGNLLTDNTSGAASLPANLAGVLDKGSSYTGNDRDIVQLRPGTLERAQTWQRLDAEYHAHGDIIVAADLTIEPGVMLTFAEDRHMSVEDGGSLDAAGSAELPILFTGTEPARGSWGGLRFNASGSLHNRLEHVTIEYAGGLVDASLYVNGTPSRPGRISVVNCTLRAGAAMGFYFDEDVVVDAFTGNTISGHALAAGSLAAQAVGVLDGGSTFEGNDDDHVEIRGGKVTSAQTWPRLDVEYLVTADLNVISDLVLDAGVVLNFARDRHMSVTDGGTLHAVASEADPIVLTGVEPTKGFWGGVRIDESNSTLNRLEHVVIEYGGGVWAANLYLSGSSGKPTLIEIIDSTFRGSERWGILLDSNTTINSDVELANKFTENSLEDVRFP